MLFRWIYIYIYNLTSLVLLYWKKKIGRNIFLRDISTNGKFFSRDIFSVGLDIRKIQ